MSEVLQVLLLIYLVPFGVMVLVGAMLMGIPVYPRDRQLGARLITFAFVWPLAALAQLPRVIREAHLGDMCKKG